MLAAILLGVAGFFVFAGWWVLIPTNIAWLVSGDKAMHQLGWMFFRDTPWGLPPGASPRLGLELANSIALVDGLPLFAIPFKLIAALLPRPFQYWGDWWLLCFVLQSLFRLPAGARAQCLAHRGALRRRLRHPHPGLPVPPVAAHGARRSLDHRRRALPLRAPRPAKTLDVAAACRRHRRGARLSLRHGRRHLVRGVSAAPPGCAG